MGIIINQSVRNAAISYIGIVIGFISTIKLFPNILEPDQFGLTRILIAISTISVQVLNFGMPNAIIKYYPFLRSKTDHPQSTFWIFIIPPFIGFFAYMVLFLTSETTILSWYASDSTLLPNYYLFVLPLVLSGTSFAFLTAFLKANFNTVFASFTQEILLRLLIILSLLLYSIDIVNFDEFVYLFISCYVLQYFTLLIYSFSKGILNFSIDFKPFTKKFNLRFFQYSFFALFSGLSALIIGNIDIIMVGTFEGLSQTGVYSIAIYVGAVILVPKKSIRKISFPVISASFKNNDLKSVEKVYKQSSNNQFLVGYLIFIGIIANLHNLYALMPPEYAEGGIVIIVIGLSYLFDMITGANGQIIISSKYYRFDFYSSVLLIVSAILFNYLFIPKYGIKGAAYATALSLVLGNIFRVWFVWFKFKIQPLSPIIFINILVGGVIFFLSTYFSPLANIYFDIIIRSLTISVFYLLSVWVFRLSPEVREIIDRIISKTFSRKQKH